MIASLPALLIAILLPLTLLEYIQLGAGALSLILIAVVIPAYRNAIRSHTRPLLLGKFSKSRILVALVCIFTVLMAISSLIPIE